MEDYNTQLCDVLKDIDKIINPPPSPIPEDNSSKKNNINDINGAINNISQCSNNNETINIIVKWLNGLGNKRKKKLFKKAMDTIQPDDSTQVVNSDNIHARLTQLSNTIQKETDFNVSNYNNNNKDVNTINYEQNKQYENMKFNKIYLFLFNIGIIFLILKFAYYKKAN